MLLLTKLSRARRRSASMLDQLAVLLGLEVLEREVLELPLDLPDAEPMRQRRVDLHRLARDALLLLRRQGLERPHVVQPVGELDDHDADVLGHGHEHLPDVLGLLLLHRPGAAELAQLRDAVDEARHLAAEALLDVGEREVGVLGDVVEQRGRQRLRVHLERGEVVGHRDRMRDVRLAGAAQLALVGGDGRLVRAPDQRLVEVRPMPRGLVDDLVDRVGGLAQRLAAARDPLHDGGRGESSQLRHGSVMLARTTLGSGAPSAADERQSLDHPNGRYLAPAPEAPPGASRTDSRRRARSSRAPSPVRPRGPAGRRAVRTA